MPDMTPPEKIYYCEFRTPKFSENKEFNSDVEYHLAPVWHDAVKDPPKESGKYIVLNSEGWVGTAFWFKRDTEWEKGNYPIIKWMPLPEPPKEEE